MTGTAGAAAPWADLAPGTPRFVPALRPVAAVAAIAALCLGGCFVARERILAGEPLPGDRIREIRRGTTTKQEILERFGPPAAIARPGTTVVFPPPGLGGRGRAEVPSEVFLELFSSGRAIRDSDVVYYYDASCLKSTGVLIVPLIGGGYHSTEMAVERLWVLVDGRTGVVEDYVYRGTD